MTHRLFSILILTLLYPSFFLFSQIPVFDYVSPGGQAMPTPIAPCNQLSNGNQNQVGAAWINYALTNDSTYEMDLTATKAVIFDQTFKVYLGETDLGADGMAFVIRDASSNNLGAGGHGQGYGRGWTCPTTGTCAIQNSIVVELDVHPNGIFANDPPSDHIAIMQDGHEDHTAATQLDSMHFSYNIEDGKTHDFRVRLESAGAGGVNLLVWFDSVDLTSTVAVSYNFTSGEIGSIFPSPSDVIWGFTSATGSISSTFLFGQGNSCDQYLASLPVEMISFDARNMRNQYIELSWATAQELNNDRFEILRNESGEWESIGMVLGNGTTDEFSSYQFVDPDPFTGINHYRLKQIDYDGAFSYSSIIAVSFDFEGNGQLVAYPNPASAFVNLHFPDLKRDQMTKVLLFDTMGRLVYQTQSYFVSGQAGEITIPTGDLNNGMYIVKFIPSGGSPVTRNVMVSH